MHSFPRHAGPRLGVATLLSFSLVFGTAAAADIYVRKDQGKTPVYTDRMEPGAELVSTSKTKKAEAAAPAPAARAAAARPAPTTAAGAGNSPREQAARTAVQRDLDATRPEQCRQATEQYNQGLRARTIRRKTESGQVEDLSEAEIANERVQLQMRMQDLCGPAR
jgi:hypothetical protein